MDSSRGLSWCVDEILMCKTALLAGNSWNAYFIVGIDGALEPTVDQRIDVNALDAGSLGQVGADFGVEIDGELQGGVIGVESAALRLAEVHLLLHVP